ncbi:isoleucine--tRNA ligase [Candidatus Micrarchaeota archaeon]|nr:isoleucine--tRNA ligase [Candidatus Micrarchaeota archaeon]
MANKIEEEVIKYWNEKGIPERVLKQHASKEEFHFVDGPPYASGRIHVGTAMNRILKDYYLRYWRAKGENVRSQPGWDCHGLPIENKVEKRLGFKTKQDIERIGIKAFNEECRKFVMEHKDIMTRQFRELGHWMHWDNPYMTLQNKYIEGAWFTFRKAFENGFLYKGAYPVHVCPHCETAVAFNEIEYEKVKENSIYIKLPVRGKKGAFLIVWTTTPWTLPANVGVMAHSKYDYAFVDVGGETWVLAKGLVEKVLKLAGKKGKVVKVVKGRELDKWEFDCLFSDLPVQKNVKHFVALADKYVSLEEGTGLVHSAPGHGREDFDVAQKVGWAVLSPVNTDGTFKPEAGPYAGRKAKEADPDIIKDLNKRGLLVAEEKIEHDYPKCWRCKSSLLFMTVPQWFFRVSAFRDELIEQNRKVRWVPEWAGKRFEDWLTNLNDWPISRQRYWGIPLPIWECKQCGEIRVIGSASELPRKLEDLHRPFIDEVTFKCSKCSKEMRRVSDVLDVWFDAGVAPWASLNGEKPDALNKLRQTEFELEGADQFRGWWNAQAITGFMTFGRIPFKTVVFHAMVLDAHGVKMSKSIGNIVQPEDVIAKHGRDTLRWYFLANDPSMDINFDWKKCEEYQRFFELIGNTVRFYETYCAARVPAKKPKLEAEDSWALSRLAHVVDQCGKLNSSYEGFKAMVAVQSFLTDDVSKTYIKMIRDRTRAASDPTSRSAASWTLRELLSASLRLLAPSLMHLSEHYYRKLYPQEESVHLAGWPAAGKRDEKLEEQVSAALHVVEAALNLRNKAAIPLRQPLRQVLVEAKEQKTKSAVESLHELIAKQANVKAVKLTAKAPGTHYEVIEVPFGKVFLDKTLDAELLREGFTRDAIRHAQSLRKKLGLVETDAVIVNVAGPKPALGMLDADTFKKAVNARELKLSEKPEFTGESSEFEHDGEKLVVTVKKAAQEGPVA